MLKAMFNGGEEDKARMEGVGHDKEVASSNFNTSLQKSIPYLWPNPTLWGRTYLYSPYKGVPPGDLCMFKKEKCVFTRVINEHVFQQKQNKTLA